MLDIKFLRENPDVVKENIKNKFQDAKLPLVDEVIELDKKSREAKLNGDRKNRLPGNANFSFPNINAQQLLLDLDEIGICASAGSACSTGNALPSHVLTAIGIPNYMIEGSLRTTFGKDNTKEEVEILVNSIEKMIKKYQ